jgi:arylsulfatase
MDVHGPYEPPQEYQRIFRNEFVDRDEAHDLFHRALDDPGSITESEHQTLIDLYDCEIRYIDDQISAFLDSVKERGFLEDSLIILTADHGDAFAEHDYYNHPRYLHEELVHVPFIVAHPSVNGECLETVVSTLDIVPTILRVFNESVPKDLPGRSLQELVSTPQGYTDRHVYLQARGEGDEAHIRRFAAQTADSMAFVKWDIESDSILEKWCSDGADHLLSNLLTYCKQRSEQTEKKEVSNDEDENGHLVNNVDDRLEALGYK